VKRLLRRIPGARSTYRHARFLYTVAAERWRDDCEQMNDRSHRAVEWDFETPAVRERNARILRALAAHHPAKEGTRALELGCADGVFTRQLAQHCASVTACDISSVARARAAERCGSLSNVTILPLDLERDAIATQYDWVFAMDLLEFVHGRDRLDGVTAKLASALQPDGILTVTACRLPQDLRAAWWTRWLPEGADAMVKFMDDRFGLRMVHREFHPDNGTQIDGYIDHMIALFRKQS
jgi:2-polyprenyl-3-methyl-5-hydroxy-6-metoxy-1,4-benzoquinol methylase